MLAPAETWENGKPVRETLAADIPLAVDHLRYFAGATRSLEGRSTEIDKDTVAYHFHEPLGVGRLPLQEGFSLAAGSGKHFITRSRMCSPGERQAGQPQEPPRA